MKRFLVVLGLSVVVWYGSVLFQGISGYKAPFNIPFSGSVCKVTGFPIATCLYGASVWLVNIINIIFWFWVIHLFVRWMDKGKSKS